MAAQDGVVSTLSYQKRIIGLHLPNILCRKCGEKEETLSHLLSSCPKSPAPNMRKRNTSTDMTQRLDFATTPYVPESIESVVTNRNCKIYWNFSFATTSQIQANKPDVVLLDVREKLMFVVEFSAPLDENLLKKEAEKKEKYSDLMDSLRTSYPEYKIKLIVLVVGALGAISENFNNNLKKIPACREKAQHLQDLMQKAVILGSLRLLRKHQAT
ncbi:hypothetical protein QE152_g1261 [Popillia japonica]|uniref:Reverse transcriptase n=1 Tax=Popillia japonica TaxID=7064 RepID=A0AAW1N9J9_POPJA